jgi:hypothetical protein
MRHPEVQRPIKTGAARPSVGNPGFLRMVYCGTDNIMTTLLRHYEY